MKKILFVCTGNTCRSPMAEALLKEKSDQFDVQSAGIFAFSDGEANPLTVKVLEEKGIRCEHQTQPLTDTLVSWADLILTMTEQHKQNVIEKFRSAEGKTFTFKQYVSDNPSDMDISDPFGGALEQYRKTLQDIETCVNRLLEKIEDKKLEG